MYEDDRNEQGGVNHNSYSNSQGYNSSSNYNNPQYNTPGNNGQGYNGGNTYPYGNGQNNGGYNSYSYGNGQQNSYGYNNNAYSYNQSNGQGYGTYQYSTVNTASPVEPPKKKNVFGKVVAAVAILALLVVGVGAAYYTVSNRASLIDKASQAVAEKEETTETTNEVAKTQVEEKVKATTVSSETKTVVTDVTAVVTEVMPAMVIIHNNYTQSASYF